MMARADLRRIAAEYVIGTLDSTERADWRARMAEDAEVAALVALWEQRLAPLNELSAPARPPEGLFDLILSRLPVRPVEVEASPEADSPAAAAPEDEQAPPEEPAPGAGESVAAEIAPPADVPNPEAEVHAEDGASESGAASVETVPAASVTPPDEVAPFAEPPLPESPSVEPPAVEPPAPAGAVPETDGQGTPEVISEGRPEPSDAPQAAPAIEAPTVAAPLPPPHVDATVRTGRNPWRPASGLLMLALLLGGGAFVYRELHHRPAPPVPEPPKQAEVAPEPPPPAPEPPPRVPESFAVLGPQPVPAIGFAFDHAAGTVSVLKMPAPPRAGTRYHLWLLTDFDGPRHVTSFDATGTFPSDLLQDVDAATLAGALLVVTEEPEGPPPPAPAGPPVFSGMAVRR